MSAQGNKFRNRPDEDPSTRRTAEDELMRSDPSRGDRGVGESGDGSAGGSGTAGGGLENEGTGSLLVNDPGGQERKDDVAPSAGEDDQRSGGANDQEEDDDNAREGYEDQGGSRDADGTRGESSGSRPGYR